MAFQQIFPFNNQLVQRLLKWRQGDEDACWRDKAIDALSKKLKRSGDYDKLRESLYKKNEDTPCVTLNRSQDGRLQVSHRKMLPHVLYCRIFRWPDLQSHHELKSVPSCQYPPSRREDSKICINPYHYSRVEHSIYPPVVTPRNAGEFSNASPPPQSPLSPGSNYSQHQQGSPNYFNNPYNSPAALQLTSAPRPAHHQSYQSPSHQQETIADPYNYANNQQMQQSAHQRAHPNTQPNQQHQGFNYYATSQSPSSDITWYQNSNGVGQNGEPLVSLAESPRAVSQFESQSPPPGYNGQDPQQLALMPMETSMEESVSLSTNASRPDDNQEPWCIITYAELAQKVGEPFKASSPLVIVDGFTNPSIHRQRFSIGVLSNINRNSTIEMTRRAIRRGVCLEKTGAQIYVRNLSDTSIFFQSKNCNVENQLNHHAVVKIEPQGRQKIFDQKVFENLVQEAIRSQDGTFERLYSLTEHSIIKMSFVKGWGSIYHRQDVTSTPCWIEIHLLTPCALIDQYIRQVNPPECQITSTS